MPPRQDDLRLVPLSLVTGLAGCTDLDSDIDNESGTLKTWTTRSRVARFGAGLMTAHR